MAGKAPMGVPSTKVELMRLDDTVSHDFAQNYTPPPHKQKTKTNKQTNTNT